MKVLDVSNGIVPLETALAIDPEFPGIIRSLAPYRMGFIHDRPSQRVRRQREFTLTSLSRHVFREMGMYCAIDNNVYDLSRKYPPILVTNLFNRHGIEETHGISNHVANPQHISTRTPEVLKSFDSPPEKMSRRNSEQPTFGTTGKPFCPDTTNSSKSARWSLRLPSTANIRLRLCLSLPLSGLLSTTGRMVTIPVQPCWLFTPHQLVWIGRRLFMMLLVRLTPPFS